MFSDLLTSGTPLLAILAVLALIDSLSYGTLAVPVWLLMTPGRVRAARPLVYLVTIGGFYFAVGVLLLLGAVSIGEAVQTVLASAFGQMLLLALGVGLVLWSFALDSPAAKARRADGGEGRMQRWRRTAMGDDGITRVSAHGAAGNTGMRAGGVHPTPRDVATVAESAPATALLRPAGSYGALMGLALTAGLVEVASMLPYLAAIALLSQSSTGMSESVLTLAGYCAVMIAPALALLAARVVFGRRLEPQLRRIDGWMTKHAGSAMSWIVGIIGVVIVVNTAPAVFGA